MQVRLKRVYDDPSPDDGYRVLVDRLWPRGLTKERAAVQWWAKDAAPSAALRRAWHAAPETEWDDFAELYRAELAAGATIADLREKFALHPAVTLVFAARDPARTHALVLRDVLETL